MKLGVGCAGELERLLGAIVAGCPGTLIAGQQQFPSRRKSTHLADNANHWALGDGRQPSCDVAFAFELARHDLLRGAVTVHATRRGVETPVELVLLGRLEVRLILDHAELVLVQRILDLLELVVCSSAFSAGRGASTRPLTGQITVAACCQCSVTTLACSWSSLEVDTLDDAAEAGAVLERLNCGLGQHEQGLAQSIGLTRELRSWYRHSDRAVR